MSYFLSTLSARFFKIRYDISNLFLIVMLLMSGSSLYAAGEHTYLDEGQVLANRLKEILIEEHVCTSIVDCQKQGGYTFMKSVKQGVKISVYNIKDAQVASRLLQACSAAFTARPLGQEMRVEIFSINILEHNGQSFFSKTPASFTLKLEKQNVNY